MSGFGQAYITASGRAGVGAGGGVGVGFARAAGEWEIALARNNKTVLETGWSQFGLRMVSTKNAPPGGVVSVLRKSQENQTLKNGAQKRT